MYVRLPFIAMRAERGNAEHTVLHILKHIRHGHLTLRLPDGSTAEFGQPNEVPSGHMIVRDARLFHRIIAQPSLGLGEGYMDGDWDAGGDDVAGVIGVLLMNDLGSEIRNDPRMVAMLAIQWLATLPITAARSRRNVHAHYDLGNRFYALMLDSTMAYSCGYRQTAADTLEDMQRNKYELICRKLQLRPGMRVLDIGCGWGGLLLHAAKYYGITGTGITLSDEQYHLATGRAKDMGIGNRAAFQLRDYRAMDGTFDRVVSIGMFEHVGRAAYDVFMEKLSTLLSSDGIGLLHTIATARRNHGIDPWITRYIFPGGELPRLPAILAAMHRHQLTAAHVENWKPHYAATLREWHGNVTEHIGEIRRLSPRFDDRFLRMWRYYLQACEAGFRWGDLQLYQILFQKGVTWRLPDVLQFHERERDADG